MLSLWSGKVPVWMVAVEVSDYQDSLRAKVLTYLRDQGPSSISGLANALLFPISNVRDKLNIARRHGHVTLVTKPQIYPSGQRVTIHEYTITEDGKKWLQLAEQ